MPDFELRKHLVRLLLEGEAHITFAAAVDGFPVEKAGIRPAGSPHSAWELLEHIRIAQEDIALFSGALEEPSKFPSLRTNPKGYSALKWPEDYWPKSQEPGDANEWKESVLAVQRNLAEFGKMIEDPERDLLNPFPWGDGQTLLREALLLADHNSYHVGQLMLVRRMLEQT